MVLKKKDVDFDVKRYPFFIKKHIFILQKGHLLKTEKANYVA